MAFSCEEGDILELALVNLFEVTGVGVLNDVLDAGKGEDMMCSTSRSSISQSVIASSVETFSHKYKFSSCNCPHTVVNPLSSF